MKIINLYRYSLSLFRTSFFLMVYAALFGCSSGMGELERDFGKSVKMMEQAQIYNMDAATNPNPDGPQGISGNKSLADLNKLERPVTAEKEMLNYIKAQKYEVGDK